MKIDINPKYKPTKNEEATIKWLNEHKIVGCLVERKENYTHFNLRKTGMLSYFTCLINYDEVDLENYLETLEAALIHYCEQEEIAKQCKILENRIKKLLRLAGEDGWFYYDSKCYPLLKDIVEFADKYPHHTHIFTIEDNLPFYRQIVQLFKELEKLLNELGTEDYEQFINLDDSEEYYYVNFIYFEYPPTNN